MDREPPEEEDIPAFDAETEARLDRAAQISEEDADRAVEAFREGAPPGFGMLLDSEEDEVP